MLSERIIARNFKGIREADLNLRNIDCAVVVGHNGAGKSSLIVDARLWSVFGESFEVKDLDKHVRNGTDVAEVIYEWEASGRHYRVVRKRSVKTARGSTSLRFEESEDGLHWEDRTAESIAETQARISKAFPIDMVTLCNSSVIGQGEVEAFCKAGPTDRARILSKILNQERYRDLEKMARREGNSKRTEIGRLENRIKENRAEAARAVEAERILLQTEQTIRDLDAEARERERSLSAKEKRLARLEEATKDYEGWKKESVEISEEIESLTAEIANDRLLMKKYRKILENRETVKAKVGDERFLKDKEAQLCLSLNAAQGGISALKERVLSESEAEGLRKEIQACEAVIANRKRIERIVKEGQGLDKRLASLKERKAHRDELVEEQRKASALLKDAEHEQRSLKEELDRVEEQVRLLDVTRCHPEVDPEYVNESCVFLKKAVAARKRIRSVEKEYNAAVKQCDSFRDRLEKICQGLEGSEGVDRMIEDVQEKYNEMNNAKADLVRIEGAVDKVKDLHGRLKKDEEVRAELKAKHAEIGMIEAEVGKIRSELNEVSRFTRLLPELEKAESELPLMEDRDRKNTKRKEELARRRREIDQRMAEAADLFSQRGSLEAEIEAERKGLAATKERAAELNQDIGRCKALIRQGEELVEKNRKFSQEIARLKEDAVDWEILAEGLRQLPFLVYEKAVPEIERVANEVLTEISPFGLRVIVETRKAAKTTKNVSDEINLRFVDNDGEKDYAQLSGGERVRAALAVRLAIGELSAKRAGERVEELILDEGWGPLDTEGINAVKECMRGLRGRFKKIFVISHIESVKDLFGTSIVVDRRSKEQVRVVSAFV